MKQYFFTGVKPPDFLNDYDVLGFDVDHTMVKYNVVELTKHIIKVHLSFLYDAGYPKDVLNFDYDKINVYLNNAVWDIKRGIILKLGEGCEVTHAV